MTESYFSSVTWRRRGGETAIGGEGRVRVRGAALSLAPALPADAGAYSCEVTAPGGDAARGDLDLQVLSESTMLFSTVQLV